MDGLDQLARHDVVHAALGMHPDGITGLSSSLFSLAIRPAEPSRLHLTVAREALAAARSPLWKSSTRRIVDLPSELPCYLVAGTISVPGIEQPLFQAKVTTAHADGLHFLVLDLTSAALQYLDSYTEIIEAITHTISFSDPEPKPAPPGPPATSRILEVLQ
ncbi:hypothetical protein AMK16_04835 [Streptomyces sp. CB00455]|uniref:hypothetical protein n=1 Tax=Streptomyces sp. CB00455 TaxID=1703927 RepID=UPI00093B2A5B|nr:hypothetical protein [Streptomyces sp. CB00455]OKK22460.1 hypothetical protein AMK16_04835 [Streptomyces sp. CB00455]